MISSELPEILRMSHRIVVMSEGRVTGTLGADEADAGERIMHCATPEHRGSSGIDDATRRRPGRRTYGSHRRAESVAAGGRGRGGRFAAGTRLQQFLAFASLIAIFVFFSIASPKLPELTNVTAILLLDRRDRPAGARARRS